MKKTNREGKNENERVKEEDIRRERKNREGEDEKEE